MDKAAFDVKYSSDPKDFIQKGGFGRVYRGFVRETQEPVVIKVVHVMEEVSEIIC